MARGQKVDKFPTFRRPIDWPERLQKAIEVHQFKLFAWDDSNCVRFALDCIYAVLGTLPSPLNDISGTLSAATLGNEKDAQQLMANLKFGNSEEAIKGIFQEIPVVMAQRGDLGFFTQDNWVIPVVMMNDGFLGHLKAGLVQLPRRMVERAYKVGV